MSNKHSRQGLARMVWLMTAMAVAGLVGLWWLTRSPTKLSEDHYAATIALYRVCNQKSVPGLDQIEAALAASDRTTDASGSAAEAIRAIIEDARQERWQQASKHCRRLLEDQVHR